MHDASRRVHPGQNKQALEQERAAHEAARATIQRRGSLLLLEKPSPSGLTLLPKGEGERIGHRVTAEQPLDLRALMDAHAEAAEKAAQNPPSFVIGQEVREVKTGGWKDELLLPAGIERISPRNIVARLATVAREELTLLLMTDGKTKSFTAAEASWIRTQFRVFMTQRAIKESVKLDFGSINIGEFADEFHLACIAATTVLERKPLAEPKTSSKTRKCRPAWALN